jgi:hypothetical protein
MRRRSKNKSIYVIFIDSDSIMDHPRWILMQCRVELGDRCDPAANEEEALVATFVEKGPYGGQAPRPVTVLYLDHDIGPVARDQVMRTAKDRQLVPFRIDLNDANRF